MQKKTNAIVINCLYWQTNTADAFLLFIQQVILQIVQLHQNESFILVFAEKIPNNLPNLSNCQTIIVGKQPKNNWQNLIWYNVKFPASLKQYAPKLVLQPFNCCSLSIKTPQLIIISQLSFLHFPKAFSKSQLWYYKTFTVQYVKKATTILTLSQITSHQIINKYKIASHKIKEVYGAVQSNMLPLGFNEQQAVKEQFTQGHNYFLVVNQSTHSTQNILTVLKAFSFFKKWQLSNFKLVIVDAQNLPNIESYKYKTDVVLMNNLNTNDFNNLTASAYANICANLNEDFSFWALQSLQVGVPLIGCQKRSLKEIVGEAALFFEANEAKNIAEQMIELYKNEDLKNSLIQKGIEQATQFSFHKTANLIWEEFKNIS